MSFDKIIFQVPDAYQVAVERLLTQFRQSPVLLGVLKSFTDEIQVLLNAIKDVEEKTSPADAVAYNLDSIGNIVGQSRELLSLSDFDWFATDTERNVDQYPVWVRNVDTTLTRVANDALFRNLIEAKINRNFVQYASVPELQEYIRTAFGVESSFVRVDTMTIAVVLGDTATQEAVDFLKMMVVNDRINNVYVLPIAAGVQVTDVIRIQDWNEGILTDEEGNPLITEDGYFIETE